jgi:mandelate racemase
MQEALPRLTIRALDVRAVDVPLARPHPTAGGAVTSAPLVLVDLHTEEGVTGHGYVFVYTPLALVPVARLVTDLATLLVGESVAPLEIERKLQARFRLLGPQGLTGIAMAAIDMAAWDALARAAGLPLARLLGGEPRPVPAYRSAGMGGVAEAVTETKEAIGIGLGAMKFKVGHPTVREDIAVIRAARETGGAELAVMVDYNQSLTVPEAMARLDALEGERLTWVEEPVAADDFAGHAAVAAAARTPIQFGENWWGPHDMAKAIAAHASDYVMLDVMKIGGVTGWLRAAALAEAHALPVSSHLFPEVSAHLLAVTPTMHWQEYTDWTNPILREPLVVRDGHAYPSTRPGSGLEWDEDAVRRYRVA